MNAKPRVHVMLDLETMALGVKPAIVQIAATTFTLGSLSVPESTFAATINLTDSVLLGLEIDPETAAWWRKQSVGAKAAVSGSCIGMAEALLGFSDWLRQFDVEGLWSHGGATDVPWLASAYDAAGLVLPWSYQAPRDTRTLFMLAEQMDWTRPEADTGTTFHDAREDVLVQIRAVVSAHRWIVGATSKTPGKAAS